MLSLNGPSWQYKSHAGVCEAAIKPSSRRLYRQAIVATMVFDSAVQGCAYVNIQVGPGHGGWNWRRKAYECGDETGY